jgi:hypothetical protein
MATTTPRKTSDSPGSGRTTRARKPRKPTAAPPPVPEEAIAEAAYYRAERRGFVPGHALEDWLEAEREFTRPSA